MWSVEEVSVKLEDILSCWCVLLARWENLGLIIGLDREHSTSYVFDSLREDNSRAMSLSLRLRDPL